MIAFKKLSRPLTQTRALELLTECTQLTASSVENTYLGGVLFIYANGVHVYRSEYMCNVWDGSVKRWGYFSRDKVAELADALN